MKPLWLTGLWDLEFFGVKVWEWKLQNNAARKQNYNINVYWKEWKRRFFWSRHLNVIENSTYMQQDELVFEDATDRILALLVSGSLQMNTYLFDLFWFMRERDD